MIFCGDQVSFDQIRQLVINMSAKKVNRFWYIEKHNETFKQ